MDININIDYEKAKIVLKVFCLVSTYFILIVRGLSMFYIRREGITIMNSIIVFSSQIFIFCVFMMYNFLFFVHTKSFRIKLKVLSYIMKLKHLNRLKTQYSSLYKELSHFLNLNIYEVGITNNILDKYTNNFKLLRNIDKSIYVVNTQIDYQLKQNKDMSKFCPYKLCITYLSPLYNRIF